MPRIAGAYGCGFEEMNSFSSSPADSLEHVRPAPHSISIRPRRLVVEERRRALQEVRGGRVVEQIGAHAARLPRDGPTPRARVEVLAAQSPSTSSAARSRCVPTSSSPSPRLSSQRANVSCNASPLGASDRAVRRRRAPADGRTRGSSPRVRTSLRRPSDASRPASSRVSRVGRQRAERLAREHPADDGRPRQHRTLARLERIDPACEERVEARRGPPRPRGRTPLRARRAARGRAARPRPPRGSPSRASRPARHAREGHRGGGGRRLPRARRAPSRRGPMRVAAREAPVGSPRPRAGGPPRRGPRIPRNRGTSGTTQCRSSSTTTTGQDAVKCSMRVRAAERGRNPRSRSRRAAVRRRRAPRPGRQGYGGAGT